MRQYQHNRRKLRTNKRFAKKGYKRMLLSYLPLVLISISTVVFISFIIVTDMMTKEAEKADAISAKRVADTLEGTARDIEDTVLRELAANRPMYAFMNASSDEDMRLTQYELSNDLYELAEQYPIIQSIYVYRAEDGKVLTMQEILPLSQFPDKEFVAAHFPTDRVQKWSSPRLFTDQFMSEPEKVLSLIHRFPLPLGSQGIVVVNVSINKLISLTEDMRSDGLSHMMIQDSRTGALLYSTNRSEMELEDTPNPDAGDFTFNYRSSYLGWTFYSGIKEGALFAWVSVISQIWIVIGIIVFLLSLFATIYIFKRNYRPVELLLDRLQQFPLQHLPKQKAVDEFAYIEKALDSLLETNQQYEQQKQEDWMRGKRQFIRDWLEGDLSPDEEWRDRARQFEIPTEAESCTVAVVELEHDQQFQQQHEERDQKILKFSLANVIREQLQPTGHIETGWVSANRLAVVWLHDHGRTPDDHEQEKMSLEELVRWVKQHLGVTIRIGVGQEVTYHSAASESYRHGNEALRYKLLHGRVILYSQLQHSSTSPAYHYYRYMAECMKHLHTMNDRWRDEAETLLQQMQTDHLADEDMLAIMEYTSMLLLEEVEGVAAADIRERLRAHIEIFNQELEQANRYSEMQTLFFEHLERFYQRYCAYKKSNKYQETITQVKRYIEQHYTDPDLSLTQISDKFALKPKYASQLFKEEFGMKFVDFLLKLRMEEAKKKLLATEDSVQDIALQVGYATSISFGRMFKKMEGISPGEYRKLKQRLTKQTLPESAAND